MRKDMKNLLVASAVALALLACLQSAGAATCHQDDEAGLLGFKKGITADPSGMLATWQAGTDCCTWDSIICLDDGRVISIGLYGNPGRPNFFLSGKISCSISKLTHLIGFNLVSHPNITGRFPRALFRLAALKSVSIASTGLSGSLPIDFGDFAGPLEDIGLSGNHFIGPIPRSISKLTTLSELNLGNNRLTGGIPTALKSLTKLTHLILEGNQLTGSIPDFFGSFPKLTHLILSNNKLRGNITASISALAPTLKFLQLGQNKLAGTIPDFIGNFKSLDTLDLSGNGLYGTVPKSFANLKTIFNLDLSRNELVDPFPAMNVEQIASLDLSYNHFHLNAIPAWATSSPVIFSLKLARCGIKMRLDDWKPFQTYFYDYVDLSENEITGSPVWFVSNAEFLLSFRAKGNNLSFDFGGMKFPKRMMDLDLSRNSMHGKVPAGVAALMTLNVSSNHLCGPLPATKFPASAFLENDCLCGAPLPPC